LKGYRRESSEASEAREGSQTREIELKVEDEGRLFSGELVKSVVIAGNANVNGYRSYLDGYRRTFRRSQVV
jgi:hypothetical protein